MKSESSISKIFSFVSDVKQEMDKVSWPSRNEVIITTIIVFVIAVLASMFFSVVDTFVYKVVHFIIGK